MIVEEVKQLPADQMYNFPQSNAKKWELNYKPFLEQVANFSFKDFKSFNTAYSNILQINPKCLIQMHTEMSQEEQTNLVKGFFPQLAKLALEVEKGLFAKNPLRIMGSNSPLKQSLTKLQVGCLLAHMFFLTICDQNNKNLPYSSNFRSILEFNQLPNKTKMRSIFIYLKRVLKAISESNQTYLQKEVTIQRMQLKNTIKNYDSEVYNNEGELSNIAIRPKGCIEDIDKSIRVDFANKFIGGGVLRKGAVQEEIMFACSPETYMAILLCEVMKNDESIYIFGTERIIEHKGYKNTFDIESEILQDTQTYVIAAIDATHFHTKNDFSQYSKQAVLRELNKAIAGFTGIDELDQKVGKKLLVCTGNWGCGAYNGNIQLKLVIQWIAASILKRDVVYCSFGEQFYKGDIQSVINKIKTLKLYKVLSVILTFEQYVSKNNNISLFDHFLQMK